MANWSHTYDETGLPAPGSAGSIITDHTPGKKLAKAVTEIQERAVVGVETDLEGIEDTGTIIENNTLVLRLKGAGEGTTQTLNVVVGGEWPELKTQEIEVENGLIKNVTDGQLSYPDFDLASGNVVVGQSASFNSQTRVLTITQTLREVRDGVITPSETTSGFAVMIPGGEPEGFTGTVAQVVDVSFENNSIVEYKRNFQYENGILKSIGNEYLQSVIEFEPFECG